MTAFGSPTNTRRPRRLRTTPTLRRLVRETRMSKSALIYPLFVCEGTGRKDEIGAMPGQYRVSVDCLDALLEPVLEAGVGAVLLFGLPAHKDELGSEAYAQDGIVQRALRHLSGRYPELLLVSDVCMCEYTSHGHCGILTSEGPAGRAVDNDATLPYLSRIAVSHAQAGAAMVAPSDMMDGRVAAIRAALDADGHKDTAVMAYSAKYSSAFYGPFREAADSAPAFGDRRGYQMDWHNGREAVLETLLDVAEGADIVMVKPALAYLDVITRVREQVQLPLAAYSVSGEYSMIKAAAAAGMIDERAIVAETATAVFRAGADILISYYAMEIAQMIDNGEIG